MINVCNFLKTYIQIEVIKGLTDKGKFQFPHRIRGGSRGDLPVYETITYIKININILSVST